MLVDPNEVDHPPKVKTATKLWRFSIRATVVLPRYTLLKGARF
jgi:hypothetical protein